jgi:hypothetical protein
MFWKYSGSNFRICWVSVGLVLHHCHLSSYWFHMKLNDFPVWDVVMMTMMMMVMMRMIVTMLCRA